MAAGVTDIRGYATLGTDDLPRLLVRTSDNKVFLDTGTQVGTLTGASQGAFLIPYRPNQSPQSHMYIGVQQDYKKYSAPDSTDAVVESEVGIEEQQQPPNACPNDFEYTDYVGPAAAWAAGGTASALADTVRYADTAGVILADPAQEGIVDFKASVQVSTLNGLQIGMALHFSTGEDTAVTEIYPQINKGVPLSIASIFYFSGTTGRCVIVPTQSPISAAFQISGPAPSPYATEPLASLVRGSIVQLSGGVGTEFIFVLSVTVGPDGTICFEATTTKAYLAGDSIIGVPAIGVQGIIPADTGATITCPDITYLQTGAGIGTVSTPLGTSPFNLISSDGTSVTQQFDYLGFSINVSDLERLVAVTFIFNTNPSVTYDKDGFYYQVNASDLVSHPPVQTQVDALFAEFNAGHITLDQLTEQVNAISILPSSQYTTLLVPISDLKRLGNNTGLTLSDTNGFRIQIETTGTINVRFGPNTIGIGDQPDIGKTGSPYDYLVRTRSSLTGVASNPSPPTRYGITSRRQSVHITMTDTNTDTQDDMWDIYRRGGTVTTFRYLGSTPNTGGLDSFTDNFFDTAAEGGSVIEYDNFQPWPTIDVPFTATAGVVSGVTTSITVVGTVVIITWSSASVFTNPAPSTILRWLPGTVINIDGLNAYTLWNRPVAFTLATPPAHYFSYMFRLVQNAGTAIPSTLNILEPTVANQDLPYLWGPDAEGTVFGCGDPFRPGTLYYCKAFTPDSAPDSYNQELTNPSEPLLGGMVVNGLSFGGSTKRWWALYPNFGSGNRYQAVEKPVKRGIAAPYAYATDGKTVFFCAEDGIWDLEGNSLTDGDLYNLFPHEGVVGRDYTYAGQTIYAPDYKYASMFRMGYKNNFIYFDYRDSTGAARTLVCDYRDPTNPAWVPDEYHDPISTHYGIEQQAGTLLSTSTAYDILIMGDDNGAVHVQRELMNDNGTPIPASIATPEFNGGDVRANQIYDDEFLDLIPAAVAGVSATIQSGGTAAQAPVIITSGVSRIQTSVPIGLELKYMGVYLSWTDDYDTQSIETLLRAWQPRYQAVPVSVFRWTNPGTSFGIPGYKSIPLILFAYKATATVTVTITVYDGQAPAVFTLPTTGGVLKKTLFRLSPNKGLLYFITMTSTGEFKPYLGDCEVYVSPWGRGDDMTIVHDISASMGIKS